MVKAISIQGAKTQCEAEILKALEQGSTPTLESLMTLNLIKQYLGEGTTSSGTPGTTTPGVADTPLSAIANSMALLMLPRPGQVQSIASLRPASTANLLKEGTGFNAIPATATTVQVTITTSNSALAEIGVSEAYRQFNQIAAIGSFSETPAFNGGNGIEGTPYGYGDVLLMPKSLALALRMVSNSGTSVGNQPAFACVEYFSGTAPTHLQIQRGGFDAAAFT